MNPLYNGAQRAVGLGGGIRRDSSSNIKRVHYISHPQIKPMPAIGRSASILTPQPTHITQSIVERSASILTPQHTPTQSNPIIPSILSTPSPNPQFSVDEDIILENATTQSPSSTLSNSEAIPYTPILCGPSLNIHFFDDKLSIAAEWIRPDINSLGVVSVEEKKTALSNLRNLITEFPFQIPSSIEVFDIVSNIDDPANRDPISGLYTHDLLYIIYTRIVNEQYEDCLDILITQLSDMKSGMCSQGRVTRLLQIVVMFDNFI
jgi:hypothetical protein